MKCEICNKPFRKGYERWESHEGRLIAAHYSCSEKRAQRNGTSAERIFLVQKICSNARHYAEQWERSKDRYCNQEAQTILQEAEKALKLAQLALRRELRGAK